MTDKRDESLIGKKTLAVIEATGDNQTSTAPKLKQTKAGLNNIIKGRLESPSKSFLDAIVAAYGIDLNWFLNDSKPVHPIFYLQKTGDKASLMDDDKTLWNQIRNSKGIKDIVKNLINFSAKEVNTWGDLISEYAKMKEDSKKK
ncbi:XRE family transcriptional regulator [Leptospira fletcheri]|uniref:XRE family transcriptional regulator n=1 Tax=Leptospira fletcheri TaxID=2484981 RepID=A0A4R9GID2_9LEPT|nr:XRE family transcriptional regulator [Leptospira fletcheri]TGK12369.1 XRE family transcriptional regulator [Leptospira fletcheri]